MQHRWTGREVRPSFCHLTCSLWRDLRQEGLAFSWKQSLMLSGSFSLISGFSSGMVLSSFLSSWPCPCCPLSLIILMTAFLWELEKLPQHFSSVSCSEAPASPSTQEAIQGMLCMANLQSSSSSPATSSLQGWWTGGQDRSSGSSSSGLGTVSSSPASQRTLGKRPIKRPAYWRTESEEEEENASLDEQDSLGTCFKDAEYSKSSWALGPRPEGLT